MEYVIVYTLKDDINKISAIQNATLKTNHSGLSMDYGLFGTDDWWHAIEQGLLAKKTIEGVISRIAMTGHGENYPEFEIESSDGKTRWTREGEDKYYIVGKKVRLTYIIEKFKKPSKVLGEYCETVLKIEIEK